MSWPVKQSCSTEFQPAYHSSGTRPLADIWWVVIHDEEAPNARGSAEYFTQESSGGSAHLTVDQNECYRCLPNETVPWGAASAPTLGANRHGFHIELAGYAKWTEEQWLAHLKELERAAYKAALHLDLFGAPPQFVTSGQLVIFGQGGTLRKGVTTHAEISAASRILDPKNSSRYAHHDPGGGWPRAEFMKLVGGYFKDM